MDGLIDETRIYNRALTPSEVTALYQQGTTPTITSITPIIAVLNQPTTFTVTGTHLTNGMGFTLADCDASNVEVGTGTDTQRSFQCTPSGTAGQKTGFIKTKPQGDHLYNFDVKIQPTATLPIIVDVNPKTAVLNQPTQFTVTGGNLTNGMGFTIADCDGSDSTIAAPNGEIIAKATPLTRTFVCTPRGTAGRKVGIVKTAPRELSVHYFDVVVKANATDTVTETWLGKIKYNAAVKSVPVAALRAITDTSVTFRPSMQPVVSSWLAGTTVFKVGSIIRKVRNIYPPNADGTVSIDTSPAQQADFLSSLRVNAKSVALTTDNLAGGISENTTASLRIETSSSRSSSARSANAIMSQNTADTFKFIMTDHVLYDADGDYTHTTGDQLLLNGSLIVEKPIVTFTYTNSFLPTPTAEANLKFTASEQFDLELSSQEFSFKTSKSLLLGSFLIPIPASAGTVYGKLSLFLTFDADGKAQVTASVGEAVNVNFGYTAKLADGAFKFTYSKANSVVFNKPTVVAIGALNAELKLQAALAMLVFNYDLTGVNANAGPAMKVGSKFVKTAGVKVSCSNFDLTLNANASAYMMMPEINVPEGYFGWLDTEASMVKHTASLFNQNLYSKSYILESTGCTPTP